MYGVKLAGFFISDAVDQTGSLQDLRDHVTQSPIYSLRVWDLSETFFLSMEEHSWIWIYLTLSNFHWISIPVLPSWSLVTLLPLNTCRWWESGQLHYSDAMGLSFPILIIKALDTEFKSIPLRIFNFSPPLCQPLKHLSKTYLERAIRCSIILYLPSHCPTYWIKYHPSYTRFSRPPSPSKQANHVALAAQHHHLKHVGLPAVAKPAWKCALKDHDYLGNVSVRDLQYEVCTT